MIENTGGMWTSDLPNGFLRVATDVINSHSTGLICVPAAELRQPPHLVGSGTFVRIGSLHGILTAQHVLEPLRNAPEIGIILVEGEHRVTEKIENLLLEDIARPPFEGGSPDLGFIKLSDKLVHAIQSFEFKRFYDLDFHRDLMLNGPPPKETGAWMVNGVPDVLTKPEPSGGAFDIALSFTSHCGIGGADQFSCDGPFDYVEIIADYSFNPGLPYTFGGISGGGVWFVTVDWNGAQPTPHDYIFVGMPIAETESITQGLRRILCHSHQSIYSVSYEYLVEKFS